jgi:hypothetical protein
MQEANTAFNQDKQLQIVPTSIPNINPKSTVEALNGGKPAAGLFFQRPQALSSNGSPGLQQR